MYWKSLFIISILGFSSTSYSQIIVNEGDVAPKTVVRFYGEYSGSTMVQWKKILGSESMGYFVTFIHNANEMQAWLDTKGNVVKESAEGKNVTEPLQQFLDTKYGSYKVKSMKYHNDRLSGEASYYLTLKTKAHGEFVLNLDEDFLASDNETVVAYE
ncbi:MAG: hypothetical protein JXR10_11915 [Cyclobacteriaceae bacterium]